MRETALSIPKELLSAPKINRLFIYGVIDWTWIILFSIGFYFSSIYFSIIWMILIAGRLHSLGVIAHDMAHQSLKNKTIKMRALEVLVAYPILTTFNSMAYHHNRHHRYTNTDKDPYFKINKQKSKFGKLIMAMIKGPLLNISWYLRNFYAPFVLLFPTLKNSYAKIFLQDISNKDLSDSKEVQTCLYEDLGSLVFNLMALILAFNYSILVYIYFIPILIAGFFCIYRLLMEHNYVQVENSNFESIKKCTFDHHLNFFDQIFFAPRNIGFHVVHHLHPTVALENLPKLTYYYKEHNLL